jgi:hypothetical protein
MKNPKNLHTLGPPFLINTQLTIQTSYRTAILVEGIDNMTWQVEYTNEFDLQWSELDEATQEKISVVVRLLEEKGPNLESNYSSGINGSRYSHMRELKVQSQGEPYRILYAFDHRRVAILLLVGNKTGDDRWYIRNIPIADSLYEEYLKELRDEGLR